MSPAPVGGLLISDAVEIDHVADVITNWPPASRILALRRYRLLYHLGPADLQAPKNEMDSFSHKLFGADVFYSLFRYL